MKKRIRSGAAAPVEPAAVSGSASSGADTPLHLAVVGRLGRIRDQLEHHVLLAGLRVLVSGGNDPERDASQRPAQGRLAARYRELGEQLRLVDAVREKPA